MTNPDDYGVRRAPTFLMRNGKAGRAPETIAFDGNGEPQDLDARNEAHLRAVHEALVPLLDPTRLQAIAALLAQLPYGDMIEFAEGTAGDPAKIFAWAKANTKDAR